MPIHNLVENNSNYSKSIESLWFYSKDEETTFNVNIANNKTFKSFKYKAKLLENTVAGRANGILRNSTIAVLSKCLSYFWRSLAMSLVNCKIELKLKWTKYCALLAKGNDNDDANCNNIIFTIKDTKLYVLVENVISKRQSQVIKTF